MVIPGTWSCQDETHWMQGKQKWSGAGECILLLVSVGSLLFGLRSLNLWANCSASGGVWSPPWRWLCSCAHSARCHPCQVRHEMCEWEEGWWATWMQDFRNLWWLKPLLCLASLPTWSIYCWWLLWVGTSLVGWKSWICLASHCKLSAYQESDPPLRGAERREGWWHCIRVEHRWVGFILPLEHHPQENSIPRLCHLPQGKTDEKQWSTQLHNEKQ